MLISGYGDFTRARDWINDNGGQAYFNPDGPDGDKLTLIIDSNICDVFVGWYVARGVLGDFSAWRADVFDASHEAVGPEFNETLTGTGSYVVGRPDGRTSLVGGAAKVLPA